MTDDSYIHPDFMAFAALGAMESGRGQAAQDTQVGSRFRGAMPAADDMGLPDSGNPGARLLRSMFMFGYLDYLKQGDLYVDADTGNVVEFRRIKKAG